MVLSTQLPRVALVVSLLLLASSSLAWACQPPTATREATPEEIGSFFGGQRKTVVTLLGYSGAEYEDKATMLRQATEILGQFDARSTIVNIGGTPDGIGAVYEIAKKKGYTTSGIVSTQARESKAQISPCVDILFFVKDASWGGFITGTDRLSPTSTAMVEVSDRLVAIGGGEIARDELTGAKRAGRNIRFIPADMNHKIARERALKRGQPAPTDFKGAAAALFGG